MKHLTTEPAIYGVVLVAGMVVVVGESDQATGEVLVKVAATVLVFWAAHAYAGTIAHLGDGGRGEPLRSRLAGAARHSIAHSWGMLVASSLPLAVLLLGVVGLLDDQQAIWGTLWLSVALLGVLGYAKIAPWSGNRWVRLASGAVTSALGLALVLLKASVH